MEKSTQCVGILSVSYSSPYAPEDICLKVDPDSYLITLNTLPKFLCRSCPVTAQVPRAPQFSAATICKVFHIIISAPLRTQNLHLSLQGSLSSKESSQRTAKSPHFSDSEAGYIHSTSTSKGGWGK